MDSGFSALRPSPRNDSRYPNAKANDLFHRCLAFSKFFTANRRFAATAGKQRRGMQELARCEPDFVHACRRPAFSVRSWSRRYQWQCHCGGRTGKVAAPHGARAACDRAGPHARDGRFPHQEMRSRPGPSRSTARPRSDNTDVGGRSCSGETLARQSNAGLRRPLLCCPRRRCTCRKSHADPESDGMRPMRSRVRACPLEHRVNDLCRLLPELPTQARRPRKAV